MNTLSVLNPSNLGFDRVSTMVNSVLGFDQTSSTYPPYDIEAREENHYTLTLAVAGFAEEDLDLEVKNRVLKVSGSKRQPQSDHKYFHRGIGRPFERRFNLAEHVDVAGAKLSNGLLTIDLVRELPDEMKPRSIPISGGETLEHRAGEQGGEQAGEEQQAH